MASLSFGTIHCIVVTDSIHSIRPAALLFFYVSVDYDGEYYSVMRAMDDHCSLV